MKRLLNTSLVLLFVATLSYGQWTKVTQGKFMGLEDISFADAQNGIAVSDLGLHYTTDGGKTWPDYADWNMLWLSYTYVHFLDNHTGWILGYDAVNPGYFFESIDAGKTWQKVTNPVNGLMFKMFWLNATVGFAFGGTRDICFRGDTTGTNVGYVWKTTNAGNTWTAMAVGKPYGGFTDMWMQSSGKGVLIGPYVVYTTTDFGNSWQRKSFSLHSGEGLKQAHFFNENDGLLFSTRYSPDFHTWMYSTKDSGKTWQLYSEIDHFEIPLMNPVYIIDSNNIVMTGIYGKNDGPATTQVIRSVDGGKTWKTEFKFAYNGDYMQTIKKIGNTYWGVGAQVWRCDNVPPMFTVNPGDSIAYIDSQYVQQLKAVDVDGDPLTFSLLQSPNFLSLASDIVKGIPKSTDTGKYVVKVEVSDGRGGKDTLSYNLKVDFATGVEDEIGLPTEFLLSQNYPNPFNPTTTISYSIPQSADVKIVVVNTLGQEIATLVNEFKSVGTYEVQFNASNLPSGIYFYHLTAGSYTNTKKMILIK